MKSLTIVSLLVASSQFSFWFQACDASRLKVKPSKAVIGSKEGLSASNRHDHTETNDQMQAVEMTGAKGLLQMRSASAAQVFAIVGAFFAVMIAVNAVINFLTGESVVPCLRKRDGKQEVKQEVTETMAGESINEEYLRLALPNMLSNMSTPLIGLVDSFVAAHIGSAILSAVAIGVSTFTFLYNLFIFLRKCTTGLAAQANGAGNFGEVRATAARSIGLGFSIGVVMVVFREPLMVAILSFQKPPAYAYDACVEYYNARMWGSPFALANFAIQGFLNGMKRGKQVLCQQGTLNITNAAFCVLLATSYGPFQLGAAGIGYAASLANLVAFFNGMGQVYTCLHGGFGSEPLPGEWTLSQIFKIEPLKEMCANAGAVTLRSLCLTMTQASVTATAARMASSEHPYLAANLLLMQLHTLFDKGADGFSNAAEALVGEAIGRKDVKRMHEVVKVTCKWGLGVACFFSMLWFSLGKFFLEQMTGPDTRDISNEAEVYLLWVVFGPPFAVWAFLMDGFFVGATLAKEMLYSMLFATSAFAITAYVLVGGAVGLPKLGSLPLDLGNNGLWLAFYSFLVWRALGLLVQWKSMDAKCTPAPSQSPTLDSQQG